MSESSSLPPGELFYGRPTAVELIEAVQEFLEEEVMAATEGRVRFLALVASRALGIVARQTSSDPEAWRAHAEALSGLGASSEMDVVEALRAGEWDDQLERVIAALAPGAAVRLDVANPTYARRGIL